ncbi:MAG: hypothetical protein KJP25_03920 [Gammaproteobacteria bacterium]|nr:hypothetical protein [Gammaproteobacteria bacterium]NND38365.1 hypothetical protein [Pseudomonadales bacterium]MBT8150713.1 hypothetical protein [Gammaproteobacteria bacterium]NNL11858.1 hypothetical protein [Pseudomonadales bacterium]NNM11802.1 hypothetical protein [Pseudomonadales bacterium]
MSSRNSSREASSRQAGSSRASKGGKNPGSNLLRSVDGERHGVIFEDPRDKNDRRRVINDKAIPESGCRRRVDRRSDRLNMGVWWMKRNYCVDRTVVRRKPVPNPDKTFHRGGDA